MRTTADNDLVRDVVREHLHHHPDSLRLTYIDAGFRFGVDTMLEVLGALVETLREEGNGEHVAALLVRSVLTRLIDDEQLALDAQRAGLYRLLVVPTRPGAHSGHPGGVVE
jgi:hypothetical protein